MGARDWEGTLAALRRSTDCLVALAGNPNVGKSSLFNQLTGLGVVTANYPGKTVTLNLGVAAVGDVRVGIVDLPGVYAIAAVSEDQWVARQVLLETRPDVVVVVVDATNLARNLYLALQLLDLEFPVVIALNLVDEARRHGIASAPSALAKLLGVPVVPTVATRGEGVDDLLKTAIGQAREHTSAPMRPGYGKDVSTIASQLAKQITTVSSGTLPHGLSPGALAIALLEEDTTLLGLIKEQPWGDAIVQASLRAAARVTAIHGEPAAVRLARERHGLAGTIADRVQEVSTPLKEPALAIAWRLSIAPATGVPILFATLAFLFVTLFFAGTLLSDAFYSVWNASVSPALAALAELAFGASIVGRTLLWGFDAGLAAVLGVGIPYVLTFYFLLALLEDAGYLNSATFLLDRVMHRFGLHGRAVIPLVAGAGCNVPAILGTRVLNSRRERLIASTLIVLVPCSARTAVILGAVAFYAGWQAAVATYVVVLAIVNVAGWILNHLLPGQSSGLVMEMFAFRRPSIRATITKTWQRFKDFIFVGAPVVFAGSIALGLLYETGYIWNVAAPLSPVVEGWLGLPAVAGLTLLFAVLRKELALQLLIALAVVRFGSEATNLRQFMSAQQIFVYALVNTLYIPCAATMAALARELGWRSGVIITAATIAIALLAGGVANRVLQLTGWLG